MNLLFVIIYTDETLTCSKNYNDSSKQSLSYQYNFFNEDFDLLTYAAKRSIPSFTLTRRNNCLLCIKVTKTLTYLPFFLVR